MIWNREDVLDTGTEYKFKTAPIDPNEPFRGKYITLRYDENTVAVTNEKDWTTGESVYISLTTDNDGFAKIKSISKAEPIGDQDFIKTKVRFVSGNGSNKLTIDYPFDRYYMEESKAYNAELTYRRRSEEHTSELQSLMHISYAVFCLKKKK